MRILNRPMFRYGGPIKEGVMHGMRNGGRAALVGNPLFPKTDGREHHQKWIKDIPKYIKPSYWSSLGKQGTLGGKVKNWWLRNKPSWRTQPGVVSGGTEGAAAKYASQRMAPFSTLAKAKSWIKENPVWAYGGTGVGLTSGAIPETVGAVGKTLGKVGKTVGLEVADRLIWDKIWDQDKWFKERAEKRALEEGALNAEQIEINRLKKLLEGKKIDKVIDPDAAKTLAKDSQNARLQKYLNMMGYDSAKKGALSDALIDASALVQDATTEAGSIKHADWGKLINKAIQTTSKRLDKPAQIREAVGLMSVKAAIEKDLEDPQVKELRALKIQEAEKALKGLSIGELIPGISKGLGKTRVDAEVMKNVMSVKEPDIIATIVGKKEDLQDVKDASDFTSVEDYIVKKYKGKEGIYIIDNVVVQIDANGVPDRLY